MNSLKPFLVITCLLMIALSPAASLAGPLGDFNPSAGTWRMETVDNTPVLVVDGSDPGAAAKAHFPVALYTPVTDFREGSITVRFRPVAGKSDQAGGIVFDRKDNGDYLVLRANALEDNLNLYRYASGRRTPIKEVGGAPAKSGAWHELRLVVAGSVVRGFLDGALLLTFDLGHGVSGGVGLWSKDDSVTQFRDFAVAAGRQ